jgi:hypothetical protein
VWPNIGFRIVTAGISYNYDWASDSYLESCGLS